jgi:hypothetical protein
MRRKLRLDVERLSVDSFPTAAGEDGGRGTIRGAQGDGCTRWNTCDCPSAFYYCVKHEFTFYSCDYDTTGPSGSGTC